jgi:hypothetical protein
MTREKSDASNCVNLNSLLTLESVHLDSRFFDAILDEESGNLATLVSLELNDLTQFLVVNKSAVAGKFLCADVRVCHYDERDKDGWKIIPS